MRVAVRLGAVCVLLCAFVYHPQSAWAQIAPTSTATVAGSLYDSTGKPVAGAKVTLAGPKNATTTTDKQGLFVFVGVPLGTYQISAAAEGLGTATRTVVVEGDTNVAIEYESTSVNGMKTIAHVSSSANASFNVTPASITQVSPIQNAFQGITSWRSILEQIPGISLAGLGNGCYTEAGQAEGPSIGIKVSIDGALPYETSVLVDNMPLITQSHGAITSGNGADIGFYPINSFGAADIVRGPGANAPSIVDSIGGSFVLHAPDPVSKNEFQLSASTDAYGGIVSNVLAGFRWKNLSAVITYGVNDSPGPIAGSFIPSPSSLTTIPLTVNGRSFQCSGQCTVQYLFGPYSLTTFPLYGFQTGLMSCCTNESTAWSQHSGSIALTYSFTPTLSAEIFYTGQRSDVADIGEWYTTQFVGAPGYTGPLAPGSYINSTLGSYPNAAEQDVASMLEEKVTLLTKKGALRIAALYNRTFYNGPWSFPVTGTNKLYGGGQICSNLSAGCSTGVYQPVVFNGGSYSETFPLYQVSQNWFDDTNRDFSIGYTTQLGENSHAGISYVKSGYNIPSNQTEDIGAPYFEIYSNPTSSSISETTNEYRLFVGGNPSEKTSIDLSMYFTSADYHVPNPNNPGTGPNIFVDGNGITNIIYSQPSHYTDARYDYSAPRLGFVWRPTAAVAIRAAAGGGFAEAPLSYLVGSNGVPFCSGTTCSVTLTNLNLQPEKSFSFDIGTDIRMGRASILSFDLYRSNLYGQIYNATQQTGTYAGLPLLTTEYDNLGVSRFEGLLVDVRHDVPQGMIWSFSGGFTRGYVVSLPGNFYSDASGPCNRKTATTPDGNACPNLTVVPNINFNGTFAVSVPYAQAQGTLGYHWNPDKYVSLVGTYYGNNNSFYRPAFVEWDAHGGYPINKNVTLSVTFRNITGVNDSPFQTISLANLSGAPTIAGPPSILYGEEYAPRTLLVTTNVKM